MSKQIIPSVENVPLSFNSLSKILSSVSAFIYTKDLQGRYTYANKAVLDLFGKKLIEVIGFDESHFF